MTTVELPVLQVAPAGSRPPAEEEGHRWLHTARRARQLSWASPDAQRRRRARQQRRHRGDGFGDPIAAFVISAIAIKECVELWRGTGDDCCGFHGRGERFESAEKGRA